MKKSTQIIAEDKNELERNLEVSYTYDRENGVTIGTITDKDTEEELQYWHHFNKRQREQLEYECGEHHAAQDDTQFWQQQMEIEMM